MNEPAATYEIDWNDAIESLAATVANLHAELAKRDAIIKALQRAHAATPEADAS